MDMSVLQGKFSIYIIVVEATSSLISISLVLEDFYTTQNQMSNLEISKKFALCLFWIQVGNTA